jgi:hypothetical protein
VSERKLSHAVAWFLNALLRPGDDDENRHAPRMVHDRYRPDDRNGSGYPRSSLAVKLLDPAAPGVHLKGQN